LGSDGRGEAAGCMAGCVGSNTNGAAHAAPARCCYCFLRWPRPPFTFG